MGNGIAGRIRSRISCAPSGGCSGSAGVRKQHCQRLRLRRQPYHRWKRGHPAPGEARLHRLGSLLAEQLRSGARPLASGDHPGLRPAVGALGWRCRRLPRGECIAPWLRGRSGRRPFGIPHAPTGRSHGRTPVRRASGAHGSRGERRGNGGDPGCEPVPLGMHCCRQSTGTHATGDAPRGAFPLSTGHIGQGTRHHTAGGRTPPRLLATRRTVDPRRRLPGGARSSPCCTGGRRRAGTRGPGGCAGRSCFSAIAAGGRGARERRRAPGVDHSGLLAGRTQTALHATGPVGRLRTGRDHAGLPVDTGERSRGVHGTGGGGSRVDDLENRTNEAATTGPAECGIRHPLVHHHVPARFEPPVSCSPSVRSTCPRWDSVPRPAG